MSKNEDHPFRQEGTFQEPVLKKLGFLARFENEHVRLGAVGIIATAIVLAMLMGASIACEVITNNATIDRNAEIHEHERAMEELKTKAYRERTKAFLDAANLHKASGGNIVVVEE